MTTEPTCGRAAVTGGSCPGHPAPAPPLPDVVTVTAAHVETALRSRLAVFKYDLRKGKGLECGEDGGADRYPEEAADLFDRLRSAAGAVQPAAVLSDAERRLLTYALDAAEARRRYVGPPPFDAETLAALASLRKLARGEQ